MVGCWLMDGLMMADDLDEFRRVDGWLINVDHEQWMVS